MTHDHYMEYFTARIRRRRIGRAHAQNEVEAICDRFRYKECNIARATTRERTPSSVL